MCHRGLVRCATGSLSPCHHHIKGTPTGPLVVKGCGLRRAYDCSRRALCSKPASPAKPFGRQPQQCSCVQILMHDGRARISSAKLPISDSPASPQVVQLWRADLAQINPKAAEALADPAQYGNLFPNLEAALETEQQMVRQATCFLLSAFVWTISAPALFLL